MLANWINSLTEIVGIKGAIIGAIFFTISMFGAAIGDSINALKIGRK